MRKEPFMRREVSVDVKGYLCFIFNVNKELLFLRMKSVNKELLFLRMKSDLGLILTRK